jgi:ribulose-phosphate 3-epimerase
VEEILLDVDLILVMTVNPGFGGQKLIPATLEKLRRLCQQTKQRGWAGELEVDGGINSQTAALAVRSGADVLVVGAALYEAPDGVQAAMTRLRQAIKDVR